MDKIDMVNVIVRYGNDPDYYCIVRRSFGGYKVEWRLGEGSRKGSRFFEDETKARTFAAKKWGWEE